MGKIYIDFQAPVLCERQAAMSIQINTSIDASCQRKVYVLRRHCWASWPQHWVKYIRG